MTNFMLINLEFIPFPENKRVKRKKTEVSWLKIAGDIE